MSRYLPRLLLLWLFVSQASAWALIEHITTYQYDDFDRLISVTDAHDKTLRYGYDLNGNRTQLTDADGKVTLTTFDELNRTTSVKTQAGTTTYTYDRSSLLTHTKFPNNTRETIEYDNAKRIRTITNTQNSAVVSQYDYTYDSNGNRTRQIEINGGAAQTTTYSYDTLDRLTSVEYPDKSTTYTYDANYNRLTETVTGSTPKSLTYSYNARNQLTGVEDTRDPNHSIAYAYDANGNQIQKTVLALPAAPTVQRFVFDARNHLRQVKVGGSTVGQFLYDAHGLRIEKQGERGTERYTYDDNSLLQEYDSSNTTLAKYDYGAHKLISLIHATEPTQYYLTDALNSVVDLSNTNGQVQARYQYDAFGNKRAESGTSANRFAFTGYTEDNETNLLYAKARYYDSDTGRFLSQDAWEGKTDTPPSLHKYLYAYQNPTVWVDPDGNAPVFKETADGLGDLADNVRATANELEDNGLNTFTAAAMGLGAGMLDIMSAATQVVNQGVNLATDAVADKNSNSQWAQESRSDLVETRGEVTNTFENTANTAQIVYENPSGAMTSVVNAAQSGVQKFASGDTGAIAEGFAALAIAPSGIAGINATAKGITAAGKGIKFAGQKTTAAIKQMAKNASMPSNPMIKQMGAVGNLSPQSKAKAYSTVYETKLSDSSYPGISREQHYQEANENLLKQLESDNEFASMMSSHGINLTRTPNGLAPRRPPENFTWHHENENGLMRLVPRDQHKSGSSFWNVLHPDGRGGYSIWGKSNDVIGNDKIYRFT